jgi:hypothetical protein
MANTGSYIIGTYTDDFGKTYNDLSFKANIASMEKTGTTFDRKTNQRNICGASGLFKMRKAIAKFNDGFSVEVPISTIENVPVMVSLLLGQPDIVCVAVKGERWSAIPPAVLGGNYATTGIDGNEKGVKAPYGYNYLLDGGDQIVLKTNIEQGVDVLVLAQIACLDSTPTGLACGVSNSGLKPRRFVGTRENNLSGGVLSRQIIVSSDDPQEIKTCGATVMTNFNCLSYTGQSIDNAELFYGSP